MSKDAAKSADAVLRVDELAERLGHRFSRIDLLRLAVTHTSVLGRTNDQESYERLEFLGDRVLSLVIAERLFAAFPEEREGELAHRHTALVRKEALAQVAANLNIGDFVILSGGEAGSGGRQNPTILADVCEAVIAAIYLDGGLDAAAKFINRNWLPMVQGAEQPPQDAKTALQEWAQGRGLPLPTYREVQREGPPHEPIFTLEVAVKGRRPSCDSASTKRGAEQAAAAKMLKKLKRSKAI